MSAPFTVAQPSRLRVPAASRGEDVAFARRDAARTRRRERLRYNQRRIVLDKL